MGKTERAALGKFVADGTLDCGGGVGSGGLKTRRGMLELWALGFCVGGNWRSGGAGMDGYVWEGRRVWGDASLSSVVTLGGLA